jgi:hypothetical protein
MKGIMNIRMLVFGFLFLSVNLSHGMQAPSPEKRGVKRPASRELIRREELPVQPIRLVTDTEVDALVYVMNGANLRQAPTTPPDAPRRRHVAARRNLAGMACKKQLRF